MRNISVFIATLVVTACATVRDPPPTLSGTFSGTASDGSPVVVQFVQSEDIVTGHGSVGSTPISLSALVSPHGPALLVLGGGERMPSEITLAANGQSMTMALRGEDVALMRGGAVPDPVAGDFQGRYASGGLFEVSVDLSHTGELVAGTGFFDGRPMALVAHSPSPGLAEGELLFSDASRLTIVARLSGDGRSLTIEGAGGPIELTRR